MKNVAIPSFRIAGLTLSGITVKKCKRPFFKSKISGFFVNVSWTASSVQNHLHQYGGSTNLLSLEQVLHMSHLLL